MFAEDDVRTCAKYLSETDAERALFTANVVYAWIDGRNLDPDAGSALIAMNPGIRELLDDACREDGLGGPEAKAVIVLAVVMHTVASALVERGYDLGEG